MEKFLFWYLVVCGIFCYLYIATHILRDIHHNKGVLNYILGIVFLLCPPTYVLFMLCFVLPYAIKQRRFMKKSKELILSEDEQEQIGKILEKVIEREENDK